MPMYMKLFEFYVFERKQIKKKLIVMVVAL